MMDFPIKTFNIFIDFYLTIPTIELQSIIIDEKEGVRKTHC